MRGGRVPLCGEWAQLVGWAGSRAASVPAHKLSAPGETYVLDRDGHALDLRGESEAGLITEVSWGPISAIYLAFSSEL